MTESLDINTASGAAMPSAMPTALPRYDDARLRALVDEIASRAESIQRNACAACEAASALALMEEALVFARDAAEEARGAASLPVEVLDMLQKEADLAILTVDWLARQATFGGAGLFTGKFAIEAEDERFGLPAISSCHLGGARGDTFAPRVADAARACGVQYSQSVASVLDSGPNSLATWACGAADILTGAVDEVRHLRGRLEEFYRGRVLTAVGNIAVTAANALAMAPRDVGIEEVRAALEHVRQDLARTGVARGTGGTATGAAGAGAAGRGVLCLLE